jgi:hypothetical protein
MTLSEYTKKVMENLMANPLVLPPLLPVQLVNKNEGLIAENWEVGESVENTATMLWLRHKKEKKGITLREMPFYLLMIFIIATTVAMLFGCSDNGVSSEDLSTKRCDYTIRYYHPNVDEVISLYASVPEFYKSDIQPSEPWSYVDLYNRTIVDDTTVYENVLWTEEELNEHLENNLKPTDMDYIHSIDPSCETEECQSGSRNYTAEMINELEKRKGELLSVNCHDVNYVMY